MLFKSFPLIWLGLGTQRHAKVQQLALRGNREPFDSSTKAKATPGKLSGNEAF